MKAKVYKSKYKDQNAITIESELLKAQFLPEVGSKMSSLIFKKSGKELLVQRPNKNYRLGSYDGDYLLGECSGFDEMFPTIIECYYERYPWKGTKIPDHGEVWSLRWNYELEEESIHMSVYGVRFPYKFEKWVKFVEDNILRIDYKVTNNSNFDFDFMWAAHLMINLIEGSQIILPPGVKKAICVLSKSERIGKYGDEFTWPENRVDENKIYRLDIIRSKKVKDVEKYFIKGKLKEGWCGFKYKDDNLVLAFSFPVDRVPYLSILTNEGGWDNLYNIFFEPCTASFDRLDVSKLRGEYSTVKAGKCYSWYLNITVDSREEFLEVKEDGHIV